MVIYTMNPMADTHRALRLPADLWERYALVAGKYGRAADLKIYRDWRIAHPDHVLGDDAMGPHDFLRNLRVDLEQWNRFMKVVGERACSSDHRRYIRWRVANPHRPLPSQQQAPALV